MNTIYNIPISKNNNGMLFSLLVSRKMAPGTADLGGIRALHTVLTLLGVTPDFLPGLCLVFWNKIISIIFNLRSRIYEDLSAHLVISDSFELLVYKHETVTIVF